VRSTGQRLVAWIGAGSPLCAMAPCSPRSAPLTK